VIEITISKAYFGACVQGLDTEGRCDFRRALNPAARAPADEQPDAILVSRKYLIAELSRGSRMGTSKGGKH